MTKEIPIHAATVLQELLDGITKLKPGFITGMYITGSIPLNDFHPHKSDIDFLILSNELPATKFRFQLEQLHKGIDHKFKTKLNGCYITPGSLNIHNAKSIKTLCFQEGQMNYDSFKMAPVTLYELKTKAITLSGLPAEELPVVVDINDINKFLHENINTYWKNWVTKHSAIHMRQILLILFPRLSEWVNLGVARQLYTLRTGKITSKTKAGLYCLEHLPAKYHSIIQEAIKIRNDKSDHLLRIKSSYYVQPSIKRARETIACANYIIHLFNEEYKLKT
ncbi:MAG TPA: aminoglycoside adenylyltransferase domain-containing protein [Chitinophagaceae bacterium]|nr:aminoglycoside adenylyltransferase domain-containing protein [Chitinophagaceae bacterium]